MSHWQIVFRLLLRKVQAWKHGPSILRAKAQNQHRWSVNHVLVALGHVDCRESSREVSRHGGVARRQYDRRSVLHLLAQSSDDRRRDRADANDAVIHSNSLPALPTRCLERWFLGRLLSYGTAAMGCSREQYVLLHDSRERTSRRSRRLGLTPLVGASE